MYQSDSRCFIYCSTSVITTWLQKAAASLSCLRPKVQENIQAVNHRLVVPGFHGPQEFTAF